MAKKKTQKSKQKKKVVAYKSIDIEQKAKEKFGEKPVGRFFEFTGAPSSIKYKPVKKKPKKQGPKFELRPRKFSPF